METSQYGDPDRREPPKGDASTANIPQRPESVPPDIPTILAAEMEHVIERFEASWEANVRPEIESTPVVGSTWVAIKSFTGGSLKCSGKKQVCGAMD